MGGVADAQQPGAVPATQPVDRDTQQLDMVPIRDFADAIGKARREGGDFVLQCTKPARLDRLKPTLGDHERALPIILAVDQHQNPPGVCPPSSGRRDNRIHSTSIGAPRLSTASPAAARTVEWRPSAPTTNSLSTVSGPSGVCTRAPTMPPSRSIRSVTSARIIS